MIEFFCDGINQPLRSKLISEGPRSSLCQFMDYALLCVGSSFTVGVADEKRNTALTSVITAALEHAHKMAATAEPVHKMAATTTPRHVIAASHESIQVKVDVKEPSQDTVDALANTMSDTVICSGPLPAYRGDEIHSRLSSLNGWMSKWCPQNNIGFIDNWTSFWGRPDLLKRDGVHPSWGGAAILSRNLAHSLRVHT